MINKEFGTRFQRMKHRSRSMGPPTKEEIRDALNLDLKD